MLEKSGETTTKSVRYQVPIINFGGNSGRFSKVNYAEKEKTEEDLESPLEIIILKRRNILSHFGNGISYFSTEFDSVSDKVLLFKKEGGSIKQVGVGYPTELREGNPLLKSHVMLYVLHQGEVCKMEIKGGSASDFFAFQSAYSSEEKHSFELDTSITSIKTKNDAGFSFYKMIFKFTDTKQDLDVVEEKLDEVVENLAKVDAYNKQSIGQKGSSLSAESLEDIKAARDAERKFNEIAGGSGDSGEINLDNIPF